MNEKYKIQRKEFFTKYKVENFEVWTEFSLDQIYKLRLIESDLSEYLNIIQEALKDQIRNFIELEKKFGINQIEVSSSKNNKEELVKVKYQIEKSSSKNNKEELIKMKSELEILKAQCLEIKTENFNISKNAENLLSDCRERFHKIYNSLQKKLLANTKDSPPNKSSPQLQEPSFMENYLVPARAFRPPIRNITSLNSESSPSSVYIPEQLLVNQTNCSPMPYFRPAPSINPTAIQPSRQPIILPIKSHPDDGKFTSTPHSDAILKASITFIFPCVTYPYARLFYHDQQEIRNNIPLLKAMMTGIIELSFIKEIPIKTSEICKKFGIDSKVDMQNFVYQNQKTFSQKTLKEFEKICEIPTKKALQKFLFPDLKLFISLITVETANNNRENVF